MKARKLDNYNVLNKNLKILAVESLVTETVGDTPNKVEGSSDETKLGDSQT